MPMAVAALLANCQQNGKLLCIHPVTDVSHAPEALPLLTTMMRRLNLMTSVAIALAVLPTSHLRAQEPAPPAVSAERLAMILAGEDPKTVGELKAMQTHVQDLIKRVLPATVSLPGASGVLVRRDNQSYVLSAAHVTMMAEQRIRITQSNGTTLRGTSLGANHESDVSLVRVDTLRDHAAVEIGKSSDLKRGQWVLMLGHPSGNKPGRSAPARLGRVLRAPTTGYLITDCTMQAGDSGGPLFDMQGRVVGINSRINRNLAMNMHAPIDALVDEWTELQDGKVTQSPSRRRGNRLGLGAPLDYGEGCPVFGDVPSDSKAAKAGLKKGDRLFEMDGKEITGRRSVQRVLRNFGNGDIITIIVYRDGKGLELKVPAATGEGR
ncbi:MAG: serine protease Do [Planctomycetota bacterium]|jgi:serine protease Do